jgi:hypothetical protein
MAPLRQEMCLKQSFLDGTGPMREVGIVARTGHAPEPPLSVAMPGRLGSILPTKPKPGREDVPARTSAVELPQDLFAIGQGCDGVGYHDTKPTHHVAGRNCFGEALHGDRATLVAKPPVPVGAPIAKTMVGPRLGVVECADGRRSASEDSVWCFPDGLQDGLLHAVESFDYDGSRRVALHEHGKVCRRFGGHFRRRGILLLRANLACLGVQSSVRGS